jgi:enoyl-CoA hydratase/carnithine racemase
MNEHSAPVSYRLEGEVAQVGLNRTDKRNAINDATLDALEDAVKRAEREAKAGIVFGHGAHFCAGLDLAEHAGRTPEQALKHSRRWHRVFGGIAQGEIPWIAALSGAVVGGGLELASAAHVRVADKSAFFALPEGQRGIFVGGGAAVRTARLMGVARMTDMMLTGRVASAEEGERWNLAQYVVDEGEALDTARRIAERAAGNAPLSNYAIIHALPRIQDMSSEDGLMMEAFVASFTSISPEAQERLAAFLEKRALRLDKPADGK